MRPQTSIEHDLTWTVSKGDLVRIDIPNKSDPDHSRLHGAEGTVVAIQKDDASTVTGDKRDQYIYTVKINDETLDFRWRDLRPPIQNNDN